MMLMIVFVAVSLGVSPQCKVPSAFFATLSVTVLIQALLTDIVCILGNVIITLALQLMLDIEQSSALPNNSVDYPYVFFAKLLSNFFVNYRGAATGTLLSDLILIKLMEL